MTSLAREFWMFVREERKWWMLPLLAVFGVAAAVVLLATLKPALAPLIYPLV